MDLQDIAANKLKENQSHQERHVFLHKCFDELSADFISHTGGLLSKTTLMAFLEWSHSQTIEPTEKQA